VRLVIRLYLTLICLSLALAGCQPAQPTSGPPIPTQEELCIRFNRNPETDTMCQPAKTSVGELLRDQFPEKVTTIDQVEAMLSPYLVYTTTLNTGITSVQYVVGNGSWLDDCPIPALFVFDENSKLVGIEIGDC
jgi:hypothetical protein